MRFVSRATWVTSIRTEIREGKVYRVITLPKDYRLSRRAARGRQLELTRHKKGFTVTGIPYRDYMKSAEWAEVRRRYRASKLPQHCLTCGSKELTLHHRTYKRLGAERLTDLVPLCWEHHQELHRKEKHYPKT